MKTKLLPAEKQAIEDMEKFFIKFPIERIIAELICIGYEQASCNYESTVDKDDAIRIMLEDERFATDFSRHSMMVIGGRIMIDAHDAWYKEFPNNTARG